MKPWKHRLPNKVNKKGNGALKGLGLPLCLSGILLGEMTFDNTENILRTSCLYLLNVILQVTGLPPAHCFNASSSEIHCSTIWGCWYWKWLRGWVYAEQSFWHQEIIFLRSFKQKRDLHYWKVSNIKTNSLQNFISLKLQTRVFLMLLVYHWYVFKCSAHKDQEENNQSN